MIEFHQSGINLACTVSANGKLKSIVVDRSGGNFGNFCTFT